MHDHARLAAVFGFALVISLGCASDPATVEPSPGVMPTPYTAEQIRVSNPPGTKLVFRLDEPGAPTVWREVHFVNGDADGCTMRATMRDGSGAPLAAPQPSSATWGELRDHAAFPPERTRRERATCTVTAGRFDVWLYTVTNAGEAGPTTSRFFFSLDRPGPPVLLEVEAGGVLVSRMELVEDTRR